MGGFVLWQIKIRSRHTQRPRNHLCKPDMTQHDCLGKNCRYFEKYEDAGHWKECDRKKEQKRTARQLQRIKWEQEAATEAILQNLAELFQSYIEEYQQRVRK